MSRFKVVLLSDLEPPELDMRTSMGQDEFDDLCTSIKEIGVQEPIKVNERADGKLEVVFGTRRVKAAIAVGLAKIPAVIEKMTPEAVLAARCAENLHRENVSAIDMARFIEKIIAVHGCSQEKAANMLGLSGGRVCQLLLILRKDPVIRDLVESGQLPEAVGRELLRVPNERVRHDMAGYAVRDGMNQRATRQYVEQVIATSQGGAGPQPQYTQDEYIPPQPQVVPTYPCEFCGHVVPLESMIVKRACRECGPVLDAAIQQGAFIGTAETAAAAVDGPGDRGAGSGQ